MSNWTFDRALSRSHEGMFPSTHDVRDVLPQLFGGKEPLETSYHCHQRSYRCPLRMVPVSVVSLVGMSYSVSMEFVRNSLRRQNHCRNNALPSSAAFKTLRVSTNGGCKDRASSTSVRHTIDVTERYVAAKSSMKPA
jgi:hypothetical protein